MGDLHRGFLEPLSWHGDLGHLGTVTSAIWKVVQRPWLTTLAPWADIVAGAAEGPQWGRKAPAEPGIKHQIFTTSACLFVIAFPATAAGKEMPKPRRIPRERGRSDGAHRAAERPLTSAPASGDILKKNGTDSSEIIATPTKAG